MATQAQINAWIDGNWKQSRFARWKTFWYGIYKGLDSDGWYGFQCKDAVNAYADWLGRPFTAGNAESLWRVKQNAWWKVIKPTERPRTGDVFVMWYSAGGVEYGHTGIVRTVYSTSFKSFDQNWNRSSLTQGSPPAIVSHNILAKPVQYGIRGYLRPQISSTSSIVYYTVKSGDTLTRIAQVYKTTVAQLIYWNKVKYPSLVRNPNAISIGWKLRVK